MRFPPGARADMMRTPSGGTLLVMAVICSASFLFQPEDGRSLPLVGRRCPAPPSYGC